MRRSPLAATPAAADAETRTWARLAVVGGFVATAAYTLLSATDVLLPALIAVCAFGPALAVASAGLYEVLRFHRSTVSLKLGLGANFAAAITVTMGLLAQVGFRELLELKFGTSEIAGVASPAYQAANGIQLGFDVAWDLFLVLGTFLLAMNMWSHPRFGRFYAVTGGVISIALLVLNLATFPVPPADSHLPDLGPLVGLWYFVVAIRLALSLKWLTNSRHTEEPSS